MVELGPNKRNLEDLVYADVIPIEFLRVHNRLGQL